MSIAARSIRPDWTIIIVLQVIAIHRPSRLALRDDERATATAMTSIR